MRFVGDHHIVALFQADAVLNGAQHIGEGLNGDNNNRLRAFQRGGQLLRFRAIAFAAINAPDHAFGGGELRDGFLQLIIQHGAVGDDNNGIKQLMSCSGMQRR